MKKTLFLFSCILTLASCNKKSELNIKQPKIDTLAKSNQEIYDTTPIATLCYAGVTDKDSIFLSFEDNLGTITGKLKFSLYQKDGNMGDISGLMAGDTLKLNYNFVSEGVSSDREVWFLKKGTSVVEAIGKYDETGMSYANTKNITFTGMELQPVDCKIISKQFISKPSVQPKPKVEPTVAVIPSKKEETKKTEDKKKVTNKSEKKVTTTKKAEETKEKNTPKSTKKIQEPTKTSSKEKIGSNSKKAKEKAKEKNDKK